MKKNEFKTFMLVCQIHINNEFITKDDFISYEKPIEYPFTLNDLKNVYSYLTNKFNTSSIVLLNVIPIREDKNDGK